MNIVPDLGLMFYSTVAFFILLFILGRFAFPPLVKMMEDRGEKIKESLEGAEKTRIEAQKLLDDYKAEMAKAREEAQKIIEEGRKFGESIKEELSEKARQEADRIIERATAEIEREKTAAVEELQSKMADLTIQAASKVIDKTLTKSDHEDIIKDFLLKVGSADEN